VIIEHRLPPGDAAGEYVCTVYGHLRKENLTSLRQIRKGELVGYLSDNPEYNSGFIHLHFAIRKGKYVTTVIDPRRGGWYYGGSTAIFGECNQTDPIHQQIISEWLNPTTDPTNGEGFINSHTQ
jgi:murein DD-endopeptidase MepM/ murein hydrolase activator NlpD